MDLGQDLRQLGVDLLSERGFFVVAGHGAHFFAQRTRRSDPEVGPVPVAFAEDFGPLGSESIPVVIGKLVQRGAESLDDLRDLLRVAPDGQTEVMGPGWKDPRPFWQTVIDPFDVVGIMKGRDATMPRFWEHDGIGGPRKTEAA